jgi:hypothetical protein
MLKKDITYKDLDENDVTETFWFHLSRAEMAEMALAKEGTEGGFDAWVKTIINAKDGQTVIDTFKKILLATVGIRSDDNKKFFKSEQIRQDFLCSDAYSTLFMELVTDADKMAAFINGVVPKDMKDDVAKAIKTGDTTALQGGSSTETVAAPSLQGPTARVEEKAVPQPTPPPAAPEPKDETPAWVKEGRVPTEAELRGAPPELIMEAFRRKSATAAPDPQ